MAVRLGQTVFGTVSGVVTAAGFAVCLAAAQGKIEVRKHATGVTASAAAQIQGTQYRTRKIPVLTAQTTATATAYAKANWFAAGSAQANATAYGRGTADFFGSGYADGTIQFVGTPVRLAKVRPFPAKATATLEGEAFVHEILYGKPAECRATLYGTTYHLAYGTAVCSASGSGRVSWKAGVTTEAMATAVAEVTAQYTVSLWPGIGNVEATVRAEDAVTIGGVRYLEVYGEAIATCVAENTHVAIYPSVTAFVTSNLSGRAAYVLGGQGHAQGQSTLFGTMIAASTAVTLVQGDTQAQATGRIRAQHRFKGEAHGQAIGNGIPLVTHTGVSGTGISSAFGSGTVQVRNTKVYPDNAYGVAVIQGQQNRVRSLAGVSAWVYSTAQVQIRRVHIAYGVAVATATLVGQQRRTHFASGVATANSVLLGTQFPIRERSGTAQGQSTAKLQTVQWYLKALPIVFMAEAVATAQVHSVKRELAGLPAAGQASLGGQIKYTRMFSGVAGVTATSNVYIKVNNATAAPLTRKILVSADPRVIITPTESRTLVV